jgi:hypothetical protein
MDRYFQIIACETQGASSFGQAWQQGHVVTVPGRNFITTSLGTTSVTPAALDRDRAHRGGVVWKHVVALALLSICCTNGSNNILQITNIKNNNRSSQIWMGVQRQDNKKKK